MTKFEKFTRSTSRSKAEPTVSIQKRGTLCLNKAAYEMLIGPNRVPLKKHPRKKEESDVFVELFFDRSSQTIGLNYTMPDNPDSYTVRKQPNSNSYLLSAKGFLKHYGIRAGKAKRFTAKMHGPDMLTFSIGDR